MDGVRVWPNYTVQGGRRKNGHAFKPQITWPELHLVLDPSATFGVESLKYFSLLRTESTGVRVYEQASRENRTKDDVFVIGNERVEGHRLLYLSTFYGTTQYGMHSFEGNLLAANNWAAQRGLDRAESQARQALVEAAVAVGADLFVTDDPLALSQTLTRDVFAVSDSDAISITGLHQRLRGSLLLTPELPGGTIGTWQAADIESWAMLPSLSRLFSGRSDVERSWLDLVRASASRLQRVLSARDLLLAGSMHPGAPYLFEDAEDRVERIAMNLTGMFDALARAVNTALEIGDQPSYCSFTNSRFTRKLAPDVQSVLSSPRNRGVIGLVHKIRNTIHHVDLGHAASGDAHGQVKERYVTVGGDVAPQVRAVATLLGRNDAWIAYDYPEMDLALRAVPLCEDLIEICIRIAEEVASLTAWPASNTHEELGVNDPSDWRTYRPNVEAVTRLYGLNPRSWAIV